jgi:aminoglycoside phosphotransferase (APT) family kinase protein
LIDRVEAGILDAVFNVDQFVRPTLVHRDLNLDNLLADEDGNLAAILDFDQAEAWEPMADRLKLENTNLLANLTSDNDQELAARARLERALMS